MAARAVAITARRVEALSAPLDRLACALGLPRLLRRRHRGRLRIVMYHGVVEEALTPFCWHQLPLRAFERQIAWLAKTMHVLPLDEALSRRADGTLPPNACALTFDDGLLNNRTVALPVLKRHQVPATIFLVTDHVGSERLLWPDLVFRLFECTAARTLDTGPLGLGERSLATRAANEASHAAVVLALKRMGDEERATAIAHLSGALDAPASLAPGPFALMDREDLAAMEASGLIRFGAHTCTHPILSRLPPAKVHAEIDGSLGALERLVSQPSRVFAYPNGRAIDFDERAQEVLRERGVPWALSTEPGLVGPGSDDLALPRISVGADLGFSRFRLLVSGLRP